MRRALQTYALTTVCHERKRLFQRDANAELLLATILRYRAEGRFLLHAFVIMPDHLHVLLTPAESIEKTAQLVKGGFSFAVRKQYTGEVWQDSYYAHRVENEQDYAAQLQYISDNPLRKRYGGYSWVYTSGTWRMDPWPPHAEQIAAVTNKPVPAGQSPIHRRRGNVQTRQEEASAPGHALRRA